MEDEFDGVLFLGNTSPTIVRLTREQCGDRAYMRMRLARMTLNVIQVRQASIDALKRYCAAVATN